MANNRDLIKLIYDDIWAAKKNQQFGFSNTSSKQEEQETRDIIFEEAMDHNGESNFDAKSNNFYFYGLNKAKIRTEPPNEEGVTAAFDTIGQTRRRLHDLNRFLDNSHQYTKINSEDIENIKHLIKQYSDHSHLLTFNNQLQLYDITSESQNVINPDQEHVGIILDEETKKKPSLHAELQGLKALAETFPDHELVSGPSKYSCYHCCLEFDAFNKADQEKYTSTGRIKEKPLTHYQPFDDNWFEPKLVANGPNQTNRHNLKQAMQAVTNNFHQQMAAKIDENDIYYQDNYNKALHFVYANPSNICIYPSGRKEENLDNQKLSALFLNTAATAGYQEQTISIRTYALTEG